MGFLRACLDAFVEGWNKAENKSVNKQETTIRISTSAPLRYDEPCELDLLYPEKLVSFEEIAKEDHRDLRALIYTMRGLNISSTRPFSMEELHSYDFGSGKVVYNLLEKKGLIEKLSPAEEIAALLAKEEMKAILIERGVSDKGKKQRLAEKLIDSGYKIDRRKYKKRLFTLTDKGKKEIEQHLTDMRYAISVAVRALKQENYTRAVLAYRDFDSKWGFTHSSGKAHTIFAHYDIPKSRFDFFERYPMRELNNTEDFKSTLRACLLAGLMRGCQDGFELQREVEAFSQENINCPSLLYMFDYEEEVISVMRRQIENDAGNALRYYISHLEYLSRQDGG